MYLKRTLILSDEDNNKGLVSIEKTSQTTAYFRIGGGEYAVFQFNDAPMEMYPITSEGGQLVCLLPSYVDLSGNICCAVMGYEGKAKIIMLGATSNKEGFRLKVQSNINHFTSQIKTLRSDNIQESSVDDISPEVVELFEQNPVDVDDAITDALLCECLQQDSKCEGCVYKKAFYNEEDKEEPQVVQEDTTTTTFFEQVKTSIENLFDTYPVNQELVDAIDNSQFVKVDYEGDGNFYSVGLIFDEEDLKYICYAIPSEEGLAPPKELEEFTQWLKIRDGYGYWMAYQDGKTGESVLFN